MENWKKYRKDLGIKIPEHEAIFNAVIDFSNEVLNYLLSTYDSSLSDSDNLSNHIYSWNIVVIQTFYNRFVDVYYVKTRNVPHSEIMTSIYNNLNQENVDILVKKFRNNEILSESEFEVISNAIYNPLIEFACKNYNVYNYINREEAESYIYSGIRKIANSDRYYAARYSTTCNDERIKNILKCYYNSPY